MASVQAPDVPPPATRRSPSPVPDRLDAGVAWGPCRRLPGRSYPRPERRRLSLQRRVHPLPRARPGTGTSRRCWRWARSSPCRSEARRRSSPARSPSSPLSGRSAGFSGVSLAVATAVACAVLAVGLVLLSPIQEALNIGSEATVAAGLSGIVFAVLAAVLYGFLQGAHRFHALGVSYAVSGIARVGAGRARSGPRSRSGGRAWRECCRGRGRRPRRGDRSRRHLADTRRVSAAADRTVARGFDLHRFARLRVPHERRHRSRKLLPRQRGSQASTQLRRFLARRFCSSRAPSSPFSFRRPRPAPRPEAVRRDSPGECRSDARAVARNGRSVLALVPESLLTWAFGPAFRESTALLGWFGLAMSAAALVSVYLSVYLAERDTRFPMLVALAAVAQVLVVSAWHPDPRSIVLVTLACCVASWRFTSSPSGIR